MYKSSSSRIFWLMKRVESIDRCELLSFKSLVATLMNLIALCSIEVGRFSAVVTYEFGVFLAMMKELLMQEIQRLLNSLMHALFES